MGILNNVPTIFNEMFNIYFISGPNILNNIIWFTLVFFILLGLIYFTLCTKIPTLDNKNKSKLIAFGSIIILLINPSVTVYDFFIFVPSVYYLINVVK